MNNIKTAVFNGTDTARVYGLWQWDYGQVLRIQGLSLEPAVEIHFSMSERGGESTPRIGVTQDGVTDVVIPNEILKNEGCTVDYYIYAWVYLTDEISGKTEKKIIMHVKSRPKPGDETIDTPEDRKMFREAIEAVNESADRSQTAEKSAEAWTHGDHENYPERDEDNAAYYALIASENAGSAYGSLVDTKRLASQVHSDANAAAQNTVLAEQYKAQAAQSAANALLFDQAAKSSETAAKEAQAGAESAEGNAELFANQTAEDRFAVEAAKSLIMQMGQEVADNKTSVEQDVSRFEVKHQQAVEDINNAGQEQTERVEETGESAVGEITEAKTKSLLEINTAGETQFNAINIAGETKAAEINTAGETQLQSINSAGTAQVSAVTTEGNHQVANVQEAAAEIIADRDKINQNETDIRNLKDYVINVHKAITWEEIAKAVQTGLAADMFSIGDEFTNTWTDTVSGKSYDNPLRVNHFGDAELEEGTIIHGMWLQTHYAQLKGVQFSQKRAFLACPDGLTAGTYYFTIESKWGNNVAAGDVVCFTTTIDVPAGGRVSGCYGAPDQAKENWRIYTHSADGKTVLETVTPTFEASGTNLGTQKYSSRNGNLNSAQEMTYGWNRWKTSALRQYLNSNKPKGDWWTAQDEWDIAPDQLSQIDGYLCGMDPELLAVIQPIRTVTYANTVNDGGAEDITYDRVIIPSLEQMYINPQITGEGEPHEYYRGLNGTDAKYQQYQTYEELKHYAIENHASAQYVRLRSATRGSAYAAWYVGSSGRVSGNSASGAYRFAPIVLIGVNPNISAPTDAEII